MLLLDLPTELLRDVVQQSIPGDFENLMLTCKTFHECGCEFINDYNAKLREYSRVSFNACDGQDALYWLHRLSEEPDLSHYMRTVDLNGYQKYRVHSTLRIFSENLHKSDAYRRESSSLKQNETALQRIRETIESSPYLRGDADFWVRNLLSDLGDWDPYSEHSFLTGVFFLTLLPNARTLTLPWGSKYIPSTSDARTNGVNQYKAVFNEIQRKACLHSDSSLGKVERLEFLLRVDYDTKESLDFLSPFLLLPNLEELYARSLVATQFDYHFAWNYPGVSSNLQSVELVHCAMDASGISELLAHTPHLVSFKYSHASKHHGIEAYWDAGSFVAAIGKYVGGQLQHLAITIERDGLNEIMTGVTSMREFTRLETLEVHYAYFCGPSIESGEQAFIDKPPNPGYEKWTIEAIPSLQRILPSCLQDLVLFVRCNKFSETDCARSLSLLFSGFASDRPSALPKLEKCEVFCHFDGFGNDEGKAAIHDHLKSEGVRCIFSDNLSRSPRRG